MTAVQALYLIGGFTPGKSILWHAGASNVSIAGIQMSVLGGASKTYVTASSEEKIEFCKGLGATEGFSYQTGDWATSILEATAGKGVDLIVDFVGGPYLEKNLRAIAQDGRIVCISALGGQMIKPNNRDGVDMAPIILKRARIEGSLLRNRDKAYQRRLRDLIVKHALPHIENGSFKVPVYQSLHWKDIQEAHELVERGRQVGKIVCRIS